MSEENFEGEVSPQPEASPQQEPPPQPQPEQQMEQQPPQVIEIRPPPPFEGGGLDAIIDEYAKIRGINDKRAAAVKLARTLFNMGVDPERYTKNVEAYINNMSALLSAIPDTEETIPVKGALLGKTALEASQLIRKAHFPEQTEDLELQRDLAAVRRMALTMKVLDHVFKGGGSETENKEVLELKQKIAQMEKQREIEQALSPLRSEINNLKEMIKNIQSQPKPQMQESVILKEIQRLNDRLNNIETKYGLSKEIADLKEKIAEVSRNVQTPQIPQTPTQPPDPITQVTNALDSASKLMEKLDELRKTKGKDLTELDWKAVTINTVGELGKEFIKLYKEQSTPQPQPQPQPQRRGIDPIIERRVFNYAMKKIQEGQQTINTIEAAKELGLTPNQVWDALTVIRDKGLLSMGDAHAKKEKPKVEDKTGLEIQEGEIGVSET